MEGITMNPAWDNAIAGIDTSAPLFADLAKAVTNDENAQGAARWLLTFVSSWLTSQGRIESTDNPWPAYDFAIWDIEQISDGWSMIHHSAKLYADQDRSVDAFNTLPALARFLIERLPALWAKGSAPGYHAPVTRALVLADRADTLVGMFAVGLKPNGSKDPYALRRAANHWLRQVIAK